MIEPRAYDRIVRSLALAVGLGGLGYGLIGVPEILHQARSAAVWWTPAAAILFFGSCAALAGLARSSTRSRLRILVAVVAVGYLLATATMPLAVGHGAIQAQAAWPFRDVSLAVVAAALVWRRGVAGGYLVLAGLVAAAVNGYVLGHHGWLSFGGDFARSVTLPVLLAACCVSALSVAALLDRETAVAERQAAAVAATDAADQERARFVELIHDGVMATLLQAARSTDPEILARQADRTLRKLDEFRGETAADESLDAAALLGLLRTEVESTVPVMVRRDPGADRLRVPVAAAEILAAALGEAVRNSLRHAGVPDREVGRSIAVTLGAAAVTVMLVDDGAGFDIEGVRPHRLGIAVSILGRMNRLPGGSASVASRPGAGTTVTLHWSGDGRD